VVPLRRRLGIKTKGANLERKKKKLNHNKKQR